MVQHDTLKAKGKEEFILLNKTENGGRFPIRSEILHESGRINRNECSPTVVYLVISGLASCHTAFEYQ